MRIIAGKYRRINLNTLDSLDTRPTKDMVKEALFSSLNDVEDKDFLDLFSGSGAIGIEAISRGAKRVVFNDLNREAVKIIKSNLNKIKEEDEVFNLSYEVCLNRLKDANFDIIFLDPPYKFADFDKIFDLINENNVLKKGGILVFEIKKDSVVKEKYNNLSLYKEKKYGISKLLYFREEND
ncbi:MAG: 16S rRNA (guanine(966)-N(2))-methyltransferase RsmD [Erysipelotrichaceae bacterium]|nr:16S rRNA (guanine(966)-N(2))-methyltransferase RsmD [Erysipelotrichaceae bacterium]